MKTFKSPIATFRLSFLNNPYFIMFLGCSAMAFYLFQFTVDDSFISYRFAKNLAIGNGPVFNPGERVEGFSNPLWILMLSILHHFPGDLLVYSKILGAFFYLATGFLLIRFSEYYNFSALFTILLYVFAVPVGLWSVSGMETPLYMFLICLCAYILLTGKRKLSIGTFSMVFGTLFLSRPEAILHCAVFSAVLIFQKRISIKHLTVCTGIVVIILVARFLYFGDILPNTYFAKNFQTFSRWHVTLVNYIWPYFKLPGLIFLIYAMLSLIKPHLKLFPVLWLFIACQIFFCLKVGGDWMPAWRFIVPILPLFITLVCAIHSKFYAVLKPAQYVVLTLTIGILYISANYLSARHAIIHTGAFPTLHSLKTTVSNWNPNYEKLVRWLNTYGKLDLIAVGELGYFGHYTNLKFLDLHGLIDKKIAKSGDYKNTVIGKKLPLHQTGFSVSNLGKYILERSPDLIIISPTEPYYYILDGHYVKIHSVGNFIIYAKTNTLSHGHLMAS